jgi:uncharacterized protein DUF6551
MNQAATTHKFEDKWMSVNDLEVDRSVQRSVRNTNRVDTLVRDWDDDKAGLVYVSHRANGMNAIIDGDHRNEARRRLTDSNGQIFCRVFEGLTLAEEGELFIALNPGNQPTVIDKYRVGVTTGEEEAVVIDTIAHARGFVVDGVAANGHINAVGVLRTIKKLSDKIEADPHLLDITLLVVGRAWGNNRYGVQAATLTGIARLIAEHGERIDIDVLIDKLRSYKGGPQGLLAETKLLAGIRGIRHAMAVADQITTEYNKGKTRNALPPWRYRS